MSTKLDHTRDAWKRKPLEAAEPPKAEGWRSATPASPVRRLTPEQLRERAAEMGIEVKA